MTLYDEDTDTFDLSRIPDVHDYVRFDILHNPHLLVAPTLHKLYEKAKVMADCVVPQEYGVTIEEKRDIGTKVKSPREICFNGSSLLETLSQQTPNTLLRFLFRSFFG